MLTSRSSRRSYFLENEILKDLRLRVETNDPLYNGQKKLKLRGRDLIDLPMVLFTMMELEVLDLSPTRESCMDYRLPVLPPSIGKLINLKVLMLDTNELDSIPKEICLLQSLERMSLSNNNLSELPHGMGRLRYLRSLHLANNKFDAFPVDLCDLIALEFLDLSNNFLVTLPDEVGNMRTLRTLLLMYNNIIRLPDTICHLVDLECLWLGNNRLRELPRNFGKLKHLDWGHRYSSSFLEENPLVHPPIEICRMGPRQIEKFFKEEEEEEESELQSNVAESESGGGDDEADKTFSTDHSDPTAQETPTHKGRAPVIKIHNDDDGDARGYGKRYE